MSDLYTPKIMQIDVIALLV